MSKPNNDSIKKQQRDPTDEPLNKHRRSESSNQPVEITNITDINDNCLEHIFKNFLISDLLNVADSCKRFQNAAGLAFTSKYGKHLMNFWPYRGSSGLTSMNDEEIKVSNISTCLKIIRCFGGSIARLTTCFTCVSESKYNEFDRYLDEYCFESVVELGYGGRTLVNLTNSFKKVESVNFSICSFRCEPTDINRCFPNLRVLTMHHSNMVQYAMVNIPHLELLDVCVAGEERDKLETVLQLNPQLQKLRIRGMDLDLDFLQFLSKCTQLESLSLFSGDCLTFNAKAVRIHFESLRHFETSGSYFEKLDATNISIRFEKLDEFTIHSKWNTNVIRFMQKNPFISTFTLHQSLFLTSSLRTKSLQLAKSLPTVTKINSKTFLFLIENVMEIIGECRLLNYFEFKIIKPTEYDILKELLGAEWSSSIDQNRVVKLQR